MMKEWWDKLGVWQKRLTIITGLIAALVLLGGYIQSGYSQVHWQHEADQDRKEIEEHHDEDVAMVLEELAAQKKMDRVQRNHRELSRLQRDLTGGKYGNADERTFILLEIDRLEKVIRCDEEGICK